MPGQRNVGMDHGHYEWSPFVNRGVLTWPDNAHIALCVITNLEHLEWSRPSNSYQSPTIAGGRGERPFPNYLRFSHREYGHRVGIFRVLDVLRKYNIPPTIAMDALTAEHYPSLVRHCMDSGCEFIGHGISVSRMISSNMSEQEERDYIHFSIETLKHATGSSPLGWLGPEYGESSRTPQLLAEAGIQYVCDWANDDQPYPMTTPQGELYSLPVLLDLDDSNALSERHMSINGYSRLLMEAFDTLYTEGADSGRLLVLNLHPWLIGQPFRIRFLDEALRYIMGNKGVWAATGSQIIKWYQNNQPTNNS